MSSSRDLTVGTFLHQEARKSRWQTLPLPITREILSFGTPHELADQSSVFVKATDTSTNALHLSEPISEDRVHILAERFPNVQTLTLPHTIHYVQEALAAVSSFTKLQTLTIPIMNVEDLHLLEPCKRLKHLTIGRLDGVTPDEAHWMECLAWWPDLETVEIVVAVEGIAGAFPSCLPFGLRKLAIDGMVPDVEQVLLHASLTSLEISSWPNELVAQFAACCERGRTNVSELLLRSDQVRQVGILPRIRSVEFVDKVLHDTMLLAVRAFPRLEEFRNSRQFTHLQDTMPAPSVNCRVLLPWQDTLRHCELPRSLPFDAAHLQVLEDAPLLEVLQVVVASDGPITFQCPPDLKKLRMAFLGRDISGTDVVQIDGSERLETLEVLVQNRSLTLQNLPSVETLSVWHSGRQNHAVNLQDCPNVCTALLQMDSLAIGPVLIALQGSARLTALTVHSTSALDLPMFQFPLYLIGHLSSLQKLSFRTPGLSCNEAPWLHDLQSLRELDIQAMEGNVHLWEDLDRLPRLEKLYLTMSVVRGSVEDVVCMRRLSQMFRLKELVLNYVGGFEDPLDLTPLLTLKKLQVLLLPPTPAIFGLDSLQSLRRLHFVEVYSDSNIWTQIPQLRHLEVLGISQGRLPDVVQRAHVDALPKFLSLQLHKAENPKRMTAVARSSHPPIVCDLSSLSLDSIMDVAGPTMKLDVEALGGLDHLSYYCDYLQLDPWFEWWKVNW